MEGDRKYRQQGYQDSNRDYSRPRPDDRPRPPGPKPPIDVTGPRLPRLVQAVTAARCFNCTTPLPTGSDFPAECPKCRAALHCCKQCSFFEPSTRFQCLKPIPVRIAVKDQANDCDLFQPRVTVARDSVQAPVVVSGFGGPASGGVQTPEPRNPSDARAAFDNLFRKSD
jgi:hypothetical protein